MQMHPVTVDCCGNVVEEDATESPADKTAEVGDDMMLSRARDFLKQCNPRVSWTWKSESPDAS